MKKTEGRRSHTGRMSHASEQDAAHVRVQAIGEMLEDNYMPYAMSVIVSRAIPEIDGFKPSHRKLLYTMYKMGLLKGPRTKSANIVGQTMKLNPHGDLTIYDTMVRLTRGNAALLHPYIDSKGNFGKQYSSEMQYAAPRYTEAKLDSFCETIFADMDKNVVDFADNYDGTLREPLLLPARFPSILVNANQGIAVGMASNICSFNLREVCEACIAYIHDPGSDLMSHMPAPDFSGGGELIYDREEMRKIYRSGRGSFKLRARYRVDSKAHLIEITEIPYTRSVEQIIDDVTSLVKAGKCREITDIRDETDLNGLRIAIEYRRNADPEPLMQKLFHKTRLEDSFACNFNVLVNGTPRVLGIAQILGEWVSFRRSCVQKGLEYDLEQSLNRLHLLEGLERILLDIDRAIRIIRETEKEADVVPRLCEGFGIDAVQANYVAEIKLRHLNRQYILNRTADIRDLKTESRRLRRILSSVDEVNACICQDLKAVAERFGQPRRTKLIDVGKVEVLTAEDMIADFRLKLFLTAHGYIKKLALTSLRSAGDLKLKDEDEIIQTIEAGNKEELIFFSNKASAYKLSAYEIPDHKPSDLGEYAQNLLGLEEGEEIILLYLPGDYQGELAAIFENGKGLRFPAASFETKTRRKKLKNAYSAKAPIVGLYDLCETACGAAALQTPGSAAEAAVPGNAAAIGADAVKAGAASASPQTGNRDFFVRSEQDKIILLDAELLPLMASRGSQGVQILQMKKGDRVTEVVRRSDWNVEDPEYYRIRKIPHRGFYRRETRQQSLV